MIPNQTTREWMKSRPNFQVVDLVERVDKTLQRESRGGGVEVEESGGSAHVEGGEGWSNNKEREK